jgi:hypothetical protein
MPSYRDRVLFALVLSLGGRLLVGHVSAVDRDNPAVPIPATEHGPGDFVVDARCRDCTAASELSRRGDEVMLLIVHRDGCPELAAVRALAGAK